MYPTARSPSRSGLLPASANLNAMPLQLELEDRLTASWQSPRLSWEVIENVLDQLYDDRCWVDTTYWPSLLSCALICRALTQSGLVRLYAHIGIESKTRTKSLLSCAQLYPSVASKLKGTRHVTIVQGKTSERWVERIPLILTWLCPNISSLVFFEVDFACFGTCPNILVRALGYLRNMRSLSLADCKFHNLGQVQRIITAFPALDRLSLTFESYSTVPPGSLQTVYVSPALSDVDLDDNTDNIALMNWLLGCSSVRALTLGNALDSDAIMESLGYTAPHLESLSISLDPVRHIGKRKISLSSCEKLRTLSIESASDPHNLLSTLPARSALCTLELCIWKATTPAPDWGRLADALRAPQLAKLQHVIVRAYFIQDLSRYTVLMKGDGQTSLYELRDELMNNGVAVTVFMTSGAR